MLRKVCPYSFKSIVHHEEVGDALTRFLFRLCHWESHGAQVFKVGMGWVKFWKTILANKLCALYVTLFQRVVWNADFFVFHNY